MHTHILTQTLAQRNVFANAGNYRICPLVNVPSNSFNSSSALQVVLGIAH